MSNLKRILKSRKRLEKSEMKLERARAERIWIKNNLQIHLLNYPYYKLKKMLTPKP